MATALIITERFPPLGTAGASIRVVKFLKYISSMKWKFIVLTIDPDQPVMPIAQLSSFLEDEIPDETQIVRVLPLISINKSLRQSNCVNPTTASSHKGIHIRFKTYARKWARYFKKWLFIPDEGILWVLRAFWEGYQLVRKEEIDLIYCVVPPHSSAILGTLLGKYGKKPLVLDVKDDWIDSPSFRKKPALVRSIEKQLEARAVKAACRVVVVTEPSLTLFKRRYATTGQAEKFMCLPNGCDLAEYAHLKQRSVPSQTNRFVIVSGAAGYQKNYRDITPFLIALAHFLAERPEAREQIEVVFLGKGHDHEYDSLIEGLGIGGIITETAPLPRSEFVEWLWQADLFLLVQPDENVTAVSATLYEYWAVGKAPILLIADPGASRDLLERFSLGCGFDSKNIEGVTSYLTKVFDAYVEATPQYITNVGIEAFDRRVLAQRMAEVWQECL